MPESILPYSFIVKQDGKFFEYQVTRYPSREILAGGIINSRRAAEKQARLEISKLKKVPQRENNRH